MPSKLSRLTVGVIIGVLLGGALFSSGWILRAAIAEGGIPIPGLASGRDGCYLQSPPFVLEIDGWAFKRFVEITA